jgi:hypothetical protein
MSYLTAMKVLEIRKQVKVRRNDGSLTQITVCKEALPQCSTGMDAMNDKNNSMNEPSWIGTAD